MTLIFFMKSSNIVETLIYVIRKEHFDQTPLLQLILELAQFKSSHRTSLITYQWIKKNEMLNILYQISAQQMFPVNWSLKNSIK